MRVGREGQGNLPHRKEVKIVDGAFVAEEMLLAQELRGRFK